MVRKARSGDRDAVGQMRALLWATATAEEHAREFDVTQKNGMNGTLPMATLVAEDGSGNVIGFLDVGLRSHADECDPSLPVGFVEGWFVHEAFRGRGHGRELVRAAEDWARQHGCTEMASDTWLDNEGSQRAHRALGFEEVDRCVHFRKKL